MGRVWYPQCRAILEVVLDGFDEDGSESDPLVIPCVPKQATIHGNRYNEPDMWELVFDAGDLPIDPQLVRAGTAAVYLFQTQGLRTPSQVSRQYSSLDDGAALARGRSPDELTEAERRDHFTGGDEPQIFGMFDQESLEMSGSGKWVSITGQDYTALLAGKQWKPDAGGRARRIPTGKRLDDWATQVLKEADPSGRLAVKVEGISAGSLPVVGQNEPPQTRKRGIPIESGTTYWDVLYKTVIRHGFICFVRGLDLVLTRPRNLSDLASSTVKRLAWGKNVESLELTRNLGKQKVPRIVVVSYDPNSQKRLSVEYPEFGQPAPVGTLGAKEKHRGGGITKTGKARKETTEDEYQLVTLFGVTDPLALKRAAENLFTLIGRSERRIVARTRDLCDLENADMLNLHAGDAVSLEWFDFDRGIIGNEDISEDAKVQHMISRGFNIEVAGVIARQYSKFLAIARPLRVREVTYDWSVEDGLSIELDLVDFVVVDGLRGSNVEASTSKLARRTA